MVKRLFANKLFWGIFALISVASVGLAFQYADEAFPVVALDIRMSREAALDTAVDLAKSNGWGPRNPSTAGSFELDTSVRNFVELGEGGPDEFRRIVAGDLYSPYTWRVRLYREGTKEEVLVVFTPAGKPYGFSETIPEDEPGAALADSNARAVAESAARKWPIDLTAFELIQASSETRPSGRVDHSFVYERRGVSVGGDGSYRLRLTVIGDRLGEMTHYVKIPQTFTRSYEQLRSANNTIAATAFFAMALLFGIGGLGFGFLYLLRKNLLEWKKPLFWGAIVAAGIAGSELNNLRLAEMTYDTALSRNAFLFQQIASALGTFVATLVLVSLIFVAAEGLTRAAFPRHLRIWKLWSPEVAGSRQVFGRTLAGYLVLGVDLALLVGFYLVARGRFGWYVPSSFPVDPNVLATHLPWLPPLGISLYAAFVEESIFRAVPIASAVLLGRRFGRPKVWLVGAFLLQAVVFGAAHANYEAQPAFARVVELFVPSIVFGLLYFFLGLLPGIILHFAVDVAFFSIPLFATSVEGIWMHRGVVIVIAMLPLWLSLRGVFVKRGLKEAPATAYNYSWEAPVRPSRIRATQPHRKMRPPLAFGLVGLGLAGLLVYSMWADFRSDVPRLLIDRSTASDIAARALIEEGVSLSDDYRRLVTVHDDPQTEDVFIWRTEGEETYRRLMGSYLAPPHFRVRFARFTGDAVEKAEEWAVSVGATGEIRQITHTLPESSPGRRLSEEEAGEIAAGAIQRRFGIESGELRSVSAIQSNRPERTDWTFVFRDPSVELNQGEARLRVTISGDEVTDYARLVHVPDEWLRQERSASAVTSILESLSFGGLILLLLAGAIASVFGIVRGRFDVRMFRLSFLVTIVIFLGTFVNSWPSLMASLSTAQPLASQLLTRMGGSVLVAIGASAVLAVIAASISAATRESETRSGLQLFSAAGVGMVTAGVVALIALPNFSRFPTWPDLSGAETLLPEMDFGGIRIFLVIAVIIMVALSFIRDISKGWTERRFIAGSAAAGIGLILSGVLGVTSVTSWILGATAIALLLLGPSLALFLRQPSLVPVAVAVYLSLPALRQASFGAFVSSQVARSIQVLAMLGLALLWDSSVRLASSRAPQAQDDEGSSARSPEHARDL